jgi:glycosyltransferase involved in cell wall biosynthesis
VPHLSFLLPGDPSTPTGGYVYDRRTAEGLRTLGWEVDVVSLEGEFPVPGPEALEVARQRLRDIPDGRLVLIDGLALGGMPALVEAEAGRLRLVGLVHHPLSEETGLAPEQARALRQAERRALAAVAGVLVTSAHTARLLGAYGVDAARVRVVEPGTDPAAPARGSGAGGLGLLCVATLTPRKGHTLLLEALAKLRDLDWHLTCVGSLTRDPETAADVAGRIQALGLNDRVRLTGELDDTALGAAYARADLFVLPTWLEGYGMALAEALARGLPVISTRAGAVPDTVPASAGILVPPGDVQALGRALDAVMRDRGLRRRLGEGALAARARLPSWEAASRRMAIALTELTIP